MRKQLKTIQEVCKAIGDGKTLEIVSPNLGTYTLTPKEWRSQCDIDLNRSDYFVNVPDEYIPFETVEEVEPYIGKLVKHKQGREICIITGAGITGEGLQILLGRAQFSFKSVTYSFVFADGTPIGKLKE